MLNRILLPTEPPRFDVVKEESDRGLVGSACMSAEGEGDGADDAKLEPG